MLPKIVVVAFDGISPFHLAVPSLVFGEDRTGDGLPQYSIQTCSVDRLTVGTTAGYRLQVDADLSAIAGADRIIVPSWDRTRPVPANLCDAIEKAHQRGVEIIGLCLGAFSLAQMGLLDGRRATTHWRYAEEFRQRFPQVDLDAHVLWVDHGDVVTSAGTAAALDCCVHLVRKDCGTDIANRVARRLVMAPHRTAGQAQYIERPVASYEANDPVQDLLGWMMEHLAEPINLDQMALRVHLSRRHFTREFRRMTGVSPLQWVLDRRIENAQYLLETTRLPIDEVARCCGLGSSVTLRAQFRQRLLTSPSDYRRQFHQMDPTAPGSGNAMGGHG